MMIAILLLAAGAGFCWAGKALLAVHWILAGAFLIPGAVLIFIGAMGFAIETAERIKGHRSTSQMVSENLEALEDYSPPPPVPPNNNISIMAGRHLSPIRDDRDE
ncbi:MAG: hypothetical protein Q8J63_00730 [Candidatus Aquicultor sp.]|nr:hypothetical protein [Candidatus Aquicultor sp.]